MIILRARLFAAAFTFIAAQAAAAPGVATLLTPNGNVTGSTAAFSWLAVPEATFYQLWIGTQSPSALVHASWHTAQQAGCAGGGTCTVQIAPPLAAGGYNWFIQTWAPSGYGHWSTAKTFTFIDPRGWATMVPNDRRFTLVFNGLGVLDHETGLTWQRTPFSDSTVFSGAIGDCVGLRTAGRRGWRLPTFPELSSLVLEDNPNALPPGHPFALGATNPQFWSQSPFANSTNMLVGWFTGTTFTPESAATTSARRTWCVRGPTGADR